MTKEGLFSLIAVIIIITTIVGGYVGYTANGVSIDGWNSANLTGLQAAGNSLAFMGNMLTFQIDDVPYWLSGIFLFMSFVMIYLIAQLVRGT